MTPQDKFNYGSVLVLLALLLLVFFLSSAGVV